MTIHALPGLRVAPYTSYLSATGIVGLLREQVDPDSAGWWSGGHFHLRTRLEEEGLLDYLCLHYAPTPIASPWNAGSGFFPGERSQAREAIAATIGPRFQTYREVLALIEQTMADLSLQARPSGDDKTTLLRALADRYTPAARRWLDAVVDLGGPRPAYSALFFTGGNDAKLEMSKTFQECLVRLFVARADQARSHLRALLWDQPAPGLVSQTHGALEPGTTGSPNGSSEGACDPLGSPWSYVLALEGLVRLKPVVRRPFDPRGQASFVPDETRREDLWLPLERPPDSPPSQSLSIRYAVLPRGGKAHFALPVQTRIGSDHSAAPIFPKRHRHRQAHSLEDLGRFRLVGLELDPSQIPPWNDGPELRLASALHARFVSPDLTAAGDLCHRLLRAQRTASRAPGQPQRAARPEDIVAFLEGRTNDAKLVQLLHALSMTPVLPASHRRSHPVGLLPLSYRLLKWALARPNRRQRPTILQSLGAGDFRAAWTAALTMLRAADPALDLPEVVPQPFEPRRLGAALAFPLGSAAMKELLNSLEVSFSC